MNDINGLEINVSTLVGITLMDVILVGMKLLYNRGCNIYRCHINGHNDLGGTIVVATLVTVLPQW